MGRIHLIVQDLCLVGGGGQDGCLVGAMQFRQSSELTVWRAGSDVFYRYQTFSEPISGACL